MAAFGTTAATNVLLLFIGVATSVLAARVLGPTGRGELAAMQLWPLMWMTVVAEGPAQAIVHYVSKHPDEIWEYVVPAWLLCALAAPPCMLLGYLLMPLLLGSQSWVVVSEARLLLLGVLFQCVEAVYLVLQARQEFVAYNAFRLTRPLLYLLILLLLSVSGAASSVLVARAYLALGALQAALAVWVVWRIRSPKAGKGDPARASLVRAYSTRAAGGTVASLAAGRMDQFVLAALLPASQVGLYVAASGTATALNAAVSALSAVAFPRVASTPAQDQGALVALFTRWALAVSVLTTIAGAAITPLWIGWILGDDFAGAAAPAMILIAAHACRHVAQVLESGLRGLGSPAVTIWSSLASLTVSVPLLMLWTPGVGILGAAAASAAAAAGSFGVLLALARSRTSVPLIDFLWIRPRDVAAAFQALLTRAQRW